MSKLLRRPAFYIIVALVALLAVGGYLRRGTDREKLRLDQFEKQLSAHNVKSALIADRSGTIEGELRNGTKYSTKYVRDDAPRVVQEIRDSGNIETKVDHENDPIWWTLLQTFLPFILLVGAFMFVMNSMQGGGSRVM